MSDLAITKRPGSDAGDTVILEWTPPQAAQGYVMFMANGKKSSSVDGKKSSWKVAKANLPVTIRAFRTDSEGVYPPPVVTPPAGDGPVAEPPLPAFTPQRTVVVTTLTQFNTAIANLKAGDWVDVRGVQFTGGLELRNVKPSGLALITFDAGCRMTRTNSHGAILIGCTNLLMRGGDLTSTAFGGLYVSGCTDVTWYGWRAHDFARNGLLVSSADGDVVRCDLHGNIEDGPLDPAGDTNSPKGTGIHGAYVGASYTSNPSGKVRDSKFRLNVRHCKYGAAVQHGDSADGCEFWVYVEDQGTGKDGSTFTSPADIVGAAFAPYTQNSSQVNRARVHYLIGRRLLGPMVEARFLGNGSTGNVVEYARGYGVEQPAYQGSSSIVFQDCK